MSANDQPLEDLDPVRPDHVRGGAAAEDIDADDIVSTTMEKLGARRPPDPQPT